MGIQSQVFTKSFLKLGEIDMSNRHPRPMDLVECTILCLKMGDTCNFVQLENRSCFMGFVSKIL